MQVTKTYSFIETAVSPRYRKPHAVIRYGEMIVTAREMTSHEAPIALIEYHNVVFDDEANTLVYRWYNGLLWTDCPQHRMGDTYPMIADGPVTYKGGYNAFDSREEAETFISQAHDPKHCLIIDGQVWQPAAEPLYVVMTFGLGHNHGRTGLMLDHAYNSNIPHTRYFRVDRCVQAIAVAEQTALARGDTKDIPIVPHADVKILIPEAVRANPAVDYGGGGDPFLNRISVITDQASSSADAAISTLLAFAEGLGSTR